MAKLYPDWDNIKRLKVPPTEGEISLLTVLESDLDDSYEIYFNSYLDGDRPDVIILKRSCGAVIIEVKDWNLNLYSVDENNKWKVQSKTDKNRLKSPHQQVFKYKSNLYNLHLPVLGLSEALNNNFYKLIDVYVYFHCATLLQLDRLYQTAEEKVKQEIEKNGEAFKNDQILHAKYQQIDDRLRAKLQKLQRDHRISWSKDSTSKIHSKVDKSLRPNVLFTDEIYFEFKRRLQPPNSVVMQGIRISLDRRQIGLSKSISGMQKIKGVAGSGKTMILAQRALNALARHGEKVLVLTFNLSLKLYLRGRINQVCGENFPYQIEISNYHQFFNSQMNNEEISVEDYLNEFNAKGFATEDALEKMYKDGSLFAGEDTDKYKTILIDEIQDYEAEWIKIIRDFFLEENGEMVLFGEPTQNIYGREDKNLNGPVVQGFGRWQELKRSYRLDAESHLVNLFKCFHEEFLDSSYKNSDTFESSGDQSIICFDVLLYETYPGPFDEVKTADYIKNFLHEEGAIPNDTAILCSHIDILKKLSGEFEKGEKIETTFETPLEVDAIGQNQGKIDKLRRRKKNFFSLNSGKLKFSTIHSFKGMESITVICILTENDGPEIVYTGLTRAMRNLVILDCANSKYANFFNSQINTE